MAKATQKKQAKKAVAKKTSKRVVAPQGKTVQDHSTGGSLVTERNEDGSVWKQSIEEENPLEGDSD